MTERTITIPKELYEKIKKRVRDTDFSSVKEYVIYVLREIISNVEEEKMNDSAKEGFSKEDEEKVKERLRALGYM